MYIHDHLSYHMILTHFPFYPLSILLQIDFGDLNTDEVKDLFVSELYDGIELDEEDEEEKISQFVYLGKGGKDDCKRDRDCRRREICETRRRGPNRCVEEGGRSCDRNDDCRSGQRCSQDGTCIRDRSRRPRSGDRCDKRSDCSPNQRCGSNGRCVRRDLDELDEVAEEE